MRKKVVVGLSGGVDSSVAAFLLKEQGFDVTGVTILTGYQEGAEADARKVAESLGISFLTVDFSTQFRRHVTEYFTGEYLQGRTPNPCIACNRFVKWEALLQCMEKTGADHIATGHYARIAQLDNGRYAIADSAFSAKDQTYALYRLTQEQLKHTLLPLGDYAKEEIRAIAARNGLITAGKPDSQEICFIPDDDYAGFIDRTAGDSVPGPGDFVSGDGVVLGRHKGITHYTIGQRRGLELAMGRRVFVTAIRPDSNEVVIGENEELMTDRVCCRDISFMAVEGLAGPRRALVKIRYNHKGEYCMVEPQEDGTILCAFEKPVRAATPGQAAVFYEDGHILGGGTII